MTQSHQPETFISPAFLRRPSFQTATDNERQILDIVRRVEGVTRADITRLTGLTAQSISRLVDSLTQRGFIRTGARVPKGRGQPSVVVELVPDMAYTVGVSIMTDAVSVALMDFSGKVLKELSTAVSPMVQEDVVRNIQSTMETLIGEQIGSSDRLFGIGLSISGFFVGEGQKINPPPQLEDWALQDLDRTLSDYYKLPVWIENDGNAAAIGESLLGAGSWAGNFAYFYFSSGFGGGVVVNGEPLRGAHGNAGEFAGMLHIPGYDQPNLELLRTILAEQGQAFEDVSGMLAAFDPDWPGIEDWVVRAGKSLTLIASAIAAINDPEAIILGGRIPRALAERLVPHIEVFNSTRRAHPRPAPKITPSDMVGDAAAIGAAALPFKQHFFK